MEIRIIKGRRATDRSGAAEYVGRSLQTIKLWAAKRAETGFPKPVDVERSGRGVRARGDDGAKQGREWYALADLDDFRTAYITPAEAAGKARVHSITLEGDPDELLSGQQFAEVLRVRYDTFRSWVRDSKPEWTAGRDGYLPRPDHTEPYRRGVRRFWRRATVQEFIDNRPGTTPSPGRPRTTTGGER